MKNNIFISAGDVSGDLHAATLAAAIKKINPGARITALGGPALQKTADTFLADLTALSAFGFTKALTQFGALKRIFNAHIIRRWQEHRPDAVVLVDYYGFNIHVARAAHRRGIPVYYYISPQIWASRFSRVKKLARYVTKMLVILPFEEELYKKNGVNAVFVGHPLLDLVPPPPAPNSTLSKNPLIGFFPGSRSSVIARHMPLLEKAADRLTFRLGARCVVFLPAGANVDTTLAVVREEGFEERKKIDLAVTVSGTVSLENALLGIPMVVFYKLSPINYLLAKHLVNVPSIAMPNILLNEPFIPELIQQQATPENILAEAEKILKSRETVTAVKERLAALRAKLGTPGAAARAAQIILED